MTPVKIEVLALYCSSAEVADVAEVAVSSILCLPLPLLGRDDGRQGLFLVNDCC